MNEGRDFFRKWQEVYLRYCFRYTSITEMILGLIVTLYPIGVTILARKKTLTIGETTFMTIQS